MSATFSEAEIAGPHSASVPYIALSAPVSQIIGMPFQHARLYTVSVTTAEPSATMKIYDGTSAQGALVATLDLGAEMTYHYGGLRCANGIFVVVSGSSAKVTIAADAGPGHTGQLTTSGNEINDATRFAGTTDDTGKFGNVTNLFTHGQCDVTTNWSVLGAGTVVATDSSQPAPYSSQSIKVTTNSGVANQGVQPASGTGLAANPVTSGVGSIWFKGVAGAAYYTLTYWNNSDATITAGVQTNFNATGSWQLLTPAAVAVAAGKTGNQLVLQVATSAARTESFWVAHAMLQVGVSTVSPYIATSGGNTATKCLGTADSSFFIGRAATNLFRHGQADATTDINPATSGVTTRTVDTTVPGPFSSNSIRVTVDGTLASMGVLPTSATGQNLATGTNCASSVWFMGVAGAAYNVRTSILNTDATGTEGTTTGFTATGSWQLLTPASVAVASAKTGDAVRIVVTINGTRAETFWVANAMLESGQSVVAPYVATTGGVTATRNAARVQAPATLLSATQGWVAMRVKMGYASGVIPSSSLRLFQWQDDGTHSIRGVLNPNAGILQLTRLGGGSGATYTAPAQTWAAGDIFTFILKWTATGLTISVNGAAFGAPTGNTDIPTLAATLFDIGQAAGAVNLDSDVLWFAYGTGVLTDNDPAGINAWGNNDPMPSDFPPGALCTMVWHANTGTYLLA